MNHPHDTFSQEQIVEMSRLYPDKILEIGNGKVAYRGEIYTDRKSLEETIKIMNHPSAKKFAYFLYKLYSFFGLTKKS